MASNPVRKPVKTVRLRRLAVILKEKREAAGLTREEAAEKANVGRAWVYRVENAEVIPKPNNVLAYLIACKVGDEDERNAIVTLAKDAARPNWWESYGLTSDHAGFVALEAEASAKGVWEPSLIPGLLQVPRYARAVITSGPDYLDAERVEQLVRVRAERQKLLVRENPLQLSAIIDEAVLHRAVESPGVMHEQLTYLREAAEMPNVVVRVLPGGAGAHPAMTGPFAILRFPDETHGDIVYCETPAGAVYADKPEEVERSRRVFCRLAALAMTPRASIDLVARYAAEL